MPPFVSVNINLPTEDLLKGLLTRSIAVPLRPELVAETITEIFEDQFTDGDACGAWSRAYPEYLHFMYGTAIPEDISVRDTISYSAWISISLSKFQQLLPEHPMASVIANRLSALIDYLHRHFDQGSGAFGLHSRPTSRGEVRICPDLRHTAWAILTLSRLGPDDHTTAAMLSLAAQFVRAKLLEMNLARERAITFAVLHLLLSTEETSKLVLPGERLRNATLKRLESKLVEDFDERYFSWDTSVDPPKQAAIDNALFVLYCIPQDACLDSECSDVLCRVSQRLSKTTVVHVGTEAAGLPLYIGGPPHSGATALLLRLLLRDRSSVKSTKQSLMQLAQFLNTPSSERHADAPSLPWQKAAILDLVAK